MKSIVGLLNNQTKVEPAVEHLELSGISAERIHTLSTPAKIKKALGCDSSCLIRNYTIWGASLGIGVYAVFGVLAALCQCNIMHFGQEYAVFTIIGALLAGGLVGGVIGLVAGAAEYEKDTHLYIQGVRFGGKLISVEVQEDEVESVKGILSEHNALGLRVV